jgi:peptidoglycan/LPS O-acetylase OafA/YrhL
MKRHGPGEQKGRQRADGIPALDGLRGISISLVLAAHLLPLGPKSLNLNSTAGLMGMSLFFTLSGYLIVSTLRSATILGFVIKRIARILPLAYLYIFLVFLVFGLSAQALLAHSGFIINYRPDLMLPVTEHLWSLCVEVHFYVLITVFAAVGGRRALVVIWPCCLAITGLRIAEGAYFEVTTHLRMDEILTGACIATLPLKRFRPGATSLLIWTLAASAWITTSHPDGGWLLYLRPYAAGLLLLATACQPPNRLVAMLGSAPLRYIAATSYALYVFHPLTAHGWWNDGNIWQRYLLKRPLGLLITLVAAHLSTFYWEKVWIQAARSWVRSRHTGKLQPVGRLENVPGE